jgi:hypothetical protein
VKTAGWQVMAGWRVMDDKAPDRSYVVIQAVFARRMVSSSTGTMPVMRWPLPALRRRVTLNMM